MGRQAQRLCLMVNLVERVHWHQRVCTHHGLAGVIKMSVHVGPAAVVHLLRATTTKEIFRKIITFNS